MSDTDAISDKPLPWTDEAKFQFLLRIIAQLRSDGKTMNWARINMAGRTTKSLQNMWTKINKEISDIEAAENGENGGTPIKPKPSTPRKGRAKKAEKSAPIIPPGGDDDDETGVNLTPVTPRKRALAARAAGNTAAKKIKKAASDEEADVVTKDGSDYEFAIEI